MIWMGKRRQGERPPRNEVKKKIRQGDTNKELGAVGVRAGIGHGEEELALVLELEAEGEGRIGRSDRLTPMVDARIAQTHFSSSNFSP